MRTISADLLTAQNLASNTPYIHLIFTSKDGGTARNYSSNIAGRRIMSLEHNEEPYNDYAIILLRDNDRTIENVVGYWTQIGYGYYTGSNVDPPNGDGSGNEYSESPRLWVKNQQEVSLGGQLYQVLELEGMWARLHETPLLIGSPPYYEQEYTTDTVYSIIGIILNRLSFTLDALGDQDDGIINTYTPNITINQQPIEASISTIYKLITMTKCYLRAKAGIAFKVIYPIAGDSVKIAYYSYQNPYLIRYSDRDTVTIPNKVYVAANQGSDGKWPNMITASAEDAADLARYPETPVAEIAGEITSQEDANARALAVLTRAAQEAKSGMMTAFHDCQLEMYDKITVTDTRSGSSITYPSSALLRVSGIRHLYTMATYRMEVNIGGLSNTDEIALLEPQVVGKKGEQYVGIEDFWSDFPTEGQYKGTQSRYYEDFWSDFPGGEPAQKAPRSVFEYLVPGVYETRKQLRKIWGHYKPKHFIDTLWQRLTPWNESKGETLWNNPFINRFRYWEK